VLDVPRGGGRAVPHDMPDDMRGRGCRTSMRHIVTCLHSWKRPEAVTTWQLCVIVVRSPQVSPCNPCSVLQPVVLMMYVSHRSVFVAS